MKQLSRNISGLGSSSILAKLGSKLRFGQASGNRRGLHNLSDTTQPSVTCLRPSCIARLGTS